MNCVGDCWDVGPPPDSILFMPPPPAPAFLPELTSNTSCLANQLCDAFITNSNRIPDGDFIEMSHKDVETWSVSNIDDTWLLVLVVSTIGVLLLGALLAMFLLKCREINMFGNNECSMHNRNDHMNHHLTHHRPVKQQERECTSVSNINNKLIHPADSVYYNGNGALQGDNRMVWAALTPHGTQHFISENYPRDMPDYGSPEVDDHYETIENLNAQPVHYQQQYATPFNYPKEYDYEDPAPLLDTYQMSSLAQNDHHHQYAVLGNPDMRCHAAFNMSGTMRREINPMMPIYRPRVSSPTRIEHPNLPPLNLYPTQTRNTLKRNTMNGGAHRNGNTLPKYGI